MRSINFVLIGKILSLLVVVVASFLLVPGLYAVVEGKYQLSQAFFVPASLSIIGFLSLALILRPRTKHIGTREGFLLVTLSWVLISLIGCVPYLLSNTSNNFFDAFFETMSGFTTTGASIFKDVEIIEPAILLWRSLTHWLGGMGVIALTVAILPMLGVSGLQLMRAETPGPDVDKITPKLTQTAKLLWLIYVGLTALQTVLLCLGGMSLFDAVNHSFATMATGGFGTKNASMGYWQQPFIHWVTTIFMFLAGVNFILYFKVMTGKALAVFKNTELKAYSLIIVVSIVICTFSIFGTSYKDFEPSLRHASFQVVSIVTSTGFATSDFGLWSFTAQAVLFVLMFVGGCTGSTAGGIKVLRITMLAKLTRHEAMYMLHPRGIFSLRLNGQGVSKELIYPMVGFVILYLGLLFLSTIIVATGGTDILSSFTASLASLGNIGPGLGRVGPAQNFSAFSDGIKLFLSIMMLLGRLELYTVMVLFLPAFWRK